MSIKECFKPKASKNSSSKNPKFYNEEKNKCIVDIATHSDANVRIVIAENSHIPTKILVGMLETEMDKQVLRKILFNEKLPRKAVAKFVNNDDDVRIEWFEDDEELIEHFKQ